MPEVFLLQSAVFSALGRYASANQCIIKLLTFENFSNYNIPYAIKSLAKFFKYNNNKNVETYYLNLAKKRIEASGLNFTVPNEVDEEKQKFKFVEDLKSEELFIQIREKIVDCKYEEAIALSSQIKVGDKNYVQVKNYECYSYVMLEKFDQVDKIFSEILKNNPSDIKYMMSVVALLPKGSEISKKYIEKIKGLENGGLVQLLCVAQDYESEEKCEEALKLLKESESYKKFVEPVVSEVARCYYYLGNRNAAAEEIKKLCIISNNDMLNKVYYEILTSEEKLPNGDLLKILYNKATKTLAPKLFSLLQCSNEEFAKRDKKEIREMFWWCFSLQTADSLKIMTEKLIVSQRFEEVASEILIDIQIFDGQKYELLKEMFRLGYRNEFYILINSKLVKIKPKYASCLFDEFNDPNGCSKGELVPVNMYLMGYADAMANYCFNSYPITNLPKYGDKLFNKLQSFAPLHRDTFSSPEIIAAVLVCMIDEKMQNKDFIARVAEDYGLSKVALIKALRLLDFIY